MNHPTNVVKSLFANFWIIHRFRSDNWKETHQSFCLCWLFSVYIECRFKMPIWKDSFFSFFFVSDNSHKFIFELLKWFGILGKKKFFKVFFWSSWSGLLFCTTDLPSKPFTVFECVCMYYRLLFFLCKFIYREISFVLWQKKIIFVLSCFGLIEFFFLLVVGTLPVKSLNSVGILTTSSNWDKNRRKWEKE